MIARPEVDDEVKARVVERQGSHVAFDELSPQLTAGAISLRLGKLRVPEILTTSIPEILAT